MGDTGGRSGPWLAVAFAWRLGYRIAAPLVILLLLGRWLDRRLATSPWFLISGLVLSLVTTNVLMFREAVRVMKGADGENSKAPNPLPAGNATAGDKHHIPNKISMTQKPKC